MVHTKSKDSSFTYDAFSMTKTKLLVSVIIPVYNSARTLDECIERVVKQTYQNWEIVIVDSDSTDDTRKISLKWSKHLGEERYKYSDIKIRSRTKARNHGVKLTTGERIFMLDSDNFLPKEFLEKCVKKVSHTNFDGLRPRTSDSWRHKGYLAKCWYFLIFAEEDGESKRWPYPNFIKRDIWLKLGGQNENLEFGEDLEFTTRFEQAGYSAPLLEKPFVMHNMPFSLKSILFKTVFSKYPKKTFDEPTPIRSTIDHSFSVKRILFMLKNPKYIVGMTFLALICIVGKIVAIIRY